MINVYKNVKPAINNRQGVYGTYNPSVHRANAIALMIARDPYLFLGRLPIGKLDIKEDIARSSKHTTTADDPRLNVVMTPSLWRIIQSFSIAATQDSLSQMAETERKLASQVSKSSISTSLINNAISMMGLDMKNLIDNEIASVQPVPLSAVALRSDATLGFLFDYISNYVDQDKFSFGSEAIEEQTPIVMSSMPGGKLTSLSDSINALIETFTPAGTSNDLFVEFTVSGRNVTSIKSLPKSINREKWTESLLDFLLVFQKPTSLKDGLNSLADKFKVDHLDAYLTKQQIQLHKDNLAAASVIIYFQLAPYIKELKVIRQILKHPFLSSKATAQYVNLLAHDRVKALLDFVDAFKLPGLTQLEYSQSIVKNVKVPGVLLPLDCAVPQQVADEFFKSSSAYEKLFGPKGVLSKLIELDRILDSSRINKEIILAASAIFGSSYSIGVQDVALQLENESDLVITDGHRISLSENQALGLTRRHIVSVSYANKGRLHLTVRAYKSSDSMIIQNDLHMAVQHEDYSPDIKSRKEDLLKFGFVESSAAFCFVKKAYLPDAMIQALRTSKAAAVVPFPLAGLPGAEDSFYKAQSLEDVLNQLGYFGAGVDVLDTLPFAKRFIVQGLDGLMLKYEHLLVGPTGLKFITHAIVGLQPMFSHWNFKLVDSVYGREDGSTLVPGLFFISLPEPMKAALLLKNSYSSSFDQDLADVFPTIQD